MPVCIARQSGSVDNVEKSLNRHDNYRGMCGRFRVLCRSVYSLKIVGRHRNRTQSPQVNSALDAVLPFDMSLKVPDRAEPVVSRLGHSFQRKEHAPYAYVDFQSKCSRCFQSRRNPAKQKRHGRRPNHQNHHALSVTGRLAGPMDLFFDDRSLQQPERATEASTF